jgi:hypothetical protein
MTIVLLEGLKTTQNRGLDKVLDLCYNTYTREAVREE